MSEALKQAEEVEVVEADRVRKRTVLLAFVTLVVVCLLSTFVELKPRSGRLAMSNLQLAALLPFVFWVLGNSLLKRYYPVLSLTSAELRLMLCVLWVGGSFAGFNWATMWTGMMSSPRYLASPENRWEELFFDYMPWWFYPTNAPGVIDRIYVGLQGSESVPWGAWFGPLSWSVLIALAITGVGIGITAIFQKQWVQHERLSYPVAQVVIDLTQGFDRRVGWPPFLKSKVFWAGFAIAAVPILWNIIGYWIIGFPKIELFEKFGGQRHIFLSRYLPFRSFSYRLLPTLIGFTFLCNLDILFGIWSVYWVSMAARYAMNRTGFAVGLQGQIIEGDAIVSLFSDGAIVGLVLWALWISRGHLKRVWQQVIAPPEEGQSSETVILRPRMALLVLGASIVFLILWLHGIGFQLHYAAFWAVLFLTGIFATMKFLAASGFAYIYPFWDRTAERVTIDVLGTRDMSESTMVGLKMVNFRTIAGWRVPHILPHLGQIRGTGHGLIPLVVGSLIVGIVVSGLYTIWLCYLEGGANLDNWNMRGAPLREYDRIAQLIGTTNRSVFDMGKMTVWMLGGGMAVLFGIFQARLPWWPVHPLGLMLLARGHMQIYMLNIVMVWAAKLFILRFGGIMLYRKMKPAAYGLIVGYVFGVGCAFLVDLIWFTEQGHMLHTW